MAFLVPTGEEHPFWSFKESMLGPCGTVWWSKFILQYIIYIPLKTQAPSSQVKSGVAFCSHMCSLNIWFIQVLNLASILTLINNFWPQPEAAYERHWLYYLYGEFPWQNSWHKTPQSPRHKLCAHKHVTTCTHFLVQ